MSLVERGRGRGRHRLAARDGHGDRHLTRLPAWVMDRGWRWPLG